MGAEHFTSHLLAHSASHIILIQKGRVICNMIGHWTSPNSISPRPMPFAAPPDSLSNWNAILTLSDGGFIETEDTYNFEAPGQDHFDDSCGNARGILSGDIGFVYVPHGPKIGRNYSLYLGSRPINPLIYSR